MLSSFGVVGGQGVRHPVVEHATDQAQANRIVGVAQYKNRHFVEASQHRPNKELLA